MANSKKNVALGKPKASGCFYTAPAGTALPADATTALDKAFQTVGYISEDGVTNATDTENAEIKEMGGGIVLKEISGYGETFQFVMLETNPVALAVRYGTDNVTSTGDNITVKHGMPDGESRVGVFEIMLGRNRVKRIVVPDYTNAEFGDTVYSAGEAVGYEVTLAANPSDLIGGKTCVEYIATVTTSGTTTGK
ncbi:hypothetical protein [Bifidobacterium biavatii]|uniref:Phage major tail protein n=1 Tax=Bifidobacterium biavatii DSM 23969 TaxID=1437608 RepID=A0A086ZU13_9BIFI|nr:hypothetical protein [Bifidobacterium biavatii]KFI50013.1 phage major tail protein [Bifidobacterium biavatii DSM 23969]